MRPIWVHWLVWFPLITIMAPFWFLFITFLDGSPREWVAFMADRYRDAKNGATP
jgi:hypothetical protein